MKYNMLHQIDLDEETNKKVAILKIKKNYPTIKYTLSILIKEYVNLLEYQGEAEKIREESKEGVNGGLSKVI